MSGIQIHLCTADKHEPVLRHSACLPRSPRVLQQMLWEKIKIGLRSARIWRGLEGTSCWVWITLPRECCLLNPEYNTRNPAGLSPQGKGWAVLEGALADRCQHSLPKTPSRTFPKEKQDLSCPSQLTVQPRDSGVLSH